MAMTIDNLEITVNVKSEKAMQKLEKLAQMLKGIGSASSASSGVSKVDEVLKSIANINLSGINAGLRTLSRYLKDIASLDKRLASVASSLQRISRAARNVGFTSSASASASTALVPWHGPVGPWLGRRVSGYLGGNTGSVPLLTAGTRGGALMPLGGDSFGGGAGGIGGESGLGGFRISGDQIADAIKKIGAAAKTAHTNTSKFARSIKTILFYSLMFRVVGAIGKAIVEGLKNMAVYSEKVNQTMSAYTSLGVYLQNTVAATIYPILEMMLPIVQNIVMWLGQMANAINIVVSSMRGMSQTIVADENYWADYLETVKATQKALLGIDQINKLGSTSDPTKMFKTIDIGSSDVA